MSARHALPPRGRRHAGSTRTRTTRTRATRTDEQLRVVHVVATLTAGGAERQLEMLASHSRHESTVIALYGTGGIAEGMRRHGLRVEELQVSGWRKALAPLALARELRRIHPDVVHVHLLSAQLLGIPAARLAGVPLVVSTEHSLMEDSIEGRPLTWWLHTGYRVLERLASHTIAVSEVTADRLRRWGVRRDRISVADLGVDLEAVAFDPAGRAAVRRELGIEPATSVIGVVGRLDPVKRTDVALRACAPQLRTGSVLVVAGAGPLLTELRALAAELGVAEQVRWLGSRDDMGAVLSAMDLLVSASADETFGMAVVEAVASGLPVVHATCPALEELAEPLGHVVKVAATGDPAADTRTIARAVGDRLGSTGQERWPAPGALVRAYGAQAAADRVDDVYDALLPRRG